MCVVVVCYGAVISGVIGMASMIGLRNKVGDLDFVAGIPDGDAELGSGIALATAAWCCSVVGLLLVAVAPKPNALLEAAANAA
jgi:hypothetical protein